MIRNLIFDLGGVVITLDQQQAVSRFVAMGVSDAAARLDPYTQQGIFGDLEAGTIDAETFRKELSAMIGREASFHECAHAWQGYAKEVPERNLIALTKLRQEGYRLLLLSNTNPFMMEWADSNQFDRHGHSLGYYFDAMYLSYQMKVMKPSSEIFHRLLISEKISPSECLFIDDSPRNVAAASQIGIKTFCPENGADWTKEIYNYIK